MRLTALDFETTGAVDGLPNEPWQLGMVDIVDGRVVAETRREMFFRMAEDRPFSRRAPGRWAQIRPLLAASPTWDESWPELSLRLAGTPLVAHNASTERTILEKRAPLTAFGPWIDTLALVRKYWPTVKSGALGDLIAVFSLQGELDALCPGRTWHDALYDACAGAVLFRHLNSMLRMYP